MANKFMILHEGEPVKNNDGSISLWYEEHDALDYLFHHWDFEIVDEQEYAEMLKEDDRVFEELNGDEG